MWAQENSPVVYSSFFSLNASRYEPAVLGQDFDKYYINVINSYAWAGNTTFSRQQFEDLVNAETGDLNAFFGNLKDNNQTGIGAIVSLMNVGFKINKEEEEFLTFKLGVSDRIEANLLYSNELFQLLWGGNAQYENQTVDFEFKANALYVREYAVGAAMNLPIENENWDFKAGVSVKYLQGLGALYSDELDFSLYTAPYGEYLELNYNYDIKTSYDDALFDEGKMNYSKAYGSGFGADVGVSASFKERFYGNLNVLDIGGVTFKKSVTTYRNSGTLLYDGIYVDNIFKGPYEFNTDFFEEVYTDVDDEGGKFTMPYPTRLRTHFSYRIPKVSDRGLTYFMHNIGLTYIQGFKNFGSATTRPYVAAAYTFNLKSAFEIGTNVGFFGYNKSEIGLFLAARAGVFRFGIGSGNLTPLFKKYGTGADFNFNISIVN